jgi:hypothetical protein
MTGIKGVSLYPVSYICSTVSEFTDKSATTKNVLSSLTAILFFVREAPQELLKGVVRLQNYTLLRDAARALQSIADNVNPYVLEQLSRIQATLNFLEPAKDLLTFTEFFTYVTERSAVDYESKTENKKWSLAFKLAYSTLETALLIPNKYKLIDLGYLCGKIGSIHSFLRIITPVTLKLTSNIFIVCDAVFGIKAANEDIKKANETLTKNNLKHKNIQVLSRATYTELTSIEEPSGFNPKQLDELRAKRGAFNALSKAAESGFEDKANSLIKVYRELLLLKSKELDLIEDIKVNGNSDLCDSNLKINENAQSLLFEKITRKVSFHEIITNNDIQRYAAKLCKNQMIQEFFGNGKKFEGVGQVIVGKISQVVEEEDIRNKDLYRNLKNIIKDFPVEGTEDELSLKKHVINFKGSLDLLDAAFNNGGLRLNLEPLISEENKEKVFKEVLCHKSSEQSRKINASKLTIERSNRTRNYNFVKIAIVASVTLGMVMVHSLPVLALAYLPALADVETFAWLSGLAIFIFGLRRTVYEIHFWKEIPGLQEKHETNLLARHL